jgi:hypothetical protein
MGDTHCESFGRFILRLARCDVVLRVAWMGRHDFRAKRTAYVSLANGSVMNSLISGVLSLIKNAQFDLTLCRFKRAAIQSVRDLVDELEEERQEFARDAGLDVDDEDFVMLSGRYRGKPLPLLGASRDEHESDKPRTRRAHDTRDLTEESERNCRELRLKLQRG